ncbi:amino acid adenylation domain-containing protein [Micromonospora sp. NPDC050187]|uniref:amino acid adenylation domain-containing protein n=1 Tax=Micromonospora sp. NPDC050187 TaxID=3364277 RepID=UPI0037977BB7
MSPLDPTELATRVRAAVAAVLRTDAGQLPADRSLRDLGINSMRAMRVAARLETGLGVPVRPWLLLEHDRIDTLVAALAAELSGGDTAPADPPGTAPSVEVGPVPPADDAPAESSSAAPARPLSHAEQTQWYLAWSQPHSTRYVFSGGVRLRGDLSVDALRAAFQAVVERHEPLRTSYRLDADGVPRAVPVAPWRFSLPVTDLSVAADPDAEIEAAVRDERDTPFDLTAGRLLRARLLRTAADEHVLLLAAHHIAFDGWSLGLLFRALGTGYRAAAGVPAPGSGGTEPGYREYVEFQASTWRRDQRVRLDWWRDQLADARTVLDVPGDLPGDPGPDGPGELLRFTVEPGLAAGMRELCRTTGVTLFVALATAYATVLHHRTGQDDLLLGTPLTHRPRPAFHQLIGMFVNTVVLRARLGPDTTFRDLLAQGRRRVLGALEHQDVPLNAVIEAAGAVRDPDRNPLFQVMFDLHSFPPDELSLPGVEVRALDGGPVGLHRFETPGREAKFDLTLTVEDSGEALLGALEYRTDRYSATWARRFADDLTTLLAQVVADPARPVRDLAASRAGESVAHGPVLTVPARTVHELVEEHARSRPDAVAVVDQGRRTTYAELDRAAGELAGRLRAAGVGPETTVGVLAERSADLVVDLLAVLRAGGAYLLLEPRHPRQRWRTMLRDGDARLLLTRTHLAARLADDDGAEPLEDVPGGTPDTDRRLLRLIPDRPPASQGRPAPDRSASRDRPPELTGLAGPDNTAYLLFTSGSTGTPKGTAVSHRAVVNAHLAWRRRYRLGPDAAVAQLAGPAFDVFSGELVRALCSGARLVIVPDEDVVDPVRLHELLCRERVTTAEFVPSVLRPLLDHGAPLPSMRLVALGVEPWTAADHHLLLRLLSPGTEVVNTYGVTEATVDSTIGALPTTGPELTGRAGAYRWPVGPPMPNTSVYVLDHRLRPVPVGQPGEVWIGGAGVAQGYRGRPGHTADRFRPDPYAPAPGRRMYRTGDRGRLLPDGQLVLLGRVDRQVKIRGIRVDPEEVEAVLGAAPGVRRAVVTVAADGPGAGLTAYLVREPGTSPDLRAVATHAARALPQAVCPVRYAVLDHPPLTPNGKIDFAALVAVPTRPVGRDRPVDRPATATERQVAALCADLLGVDEVGTRVDFFELGGHSLLLARLVGMVRDRFAVELPAREVLLDPTVATIAALVDAGEPAAPDRAGTATPTAAPTARRVRVRAVVGADSTLRVRRGGTDVRS